MPCAPRSHLLVHTLPLAIAVAMDDQDPAQPVRVHRRSSPPTSRSRVSEFEFRKRTSVKLIRTRFICGKSSQEKAKKKKKKKKKKKTQVDLSRGVRSQPSNYAVYAPDTQSGWPCHPLQPPTTTPNTLVTSKISVFVHEFNRKASWNDQSDMFMVVAKHKSKTTGGMGLAEPHVLATANDRKPHAPSHIYCAMTGAA